LPLDISVAPALLLLNPDGEVAADVVLIPSVEGLPLGPESLVTLLSVGLDSLAVDQSGNIVLSYSRSGGISGASPTGAALLVPDFSDVFVTLSPSGEVEGEFFLDGGRPAEFITNDTIFDSENRLVIVGDEIARFEFA